MCMFGFRLMGFLQAAGTKKIKGTDGKGRPKKAAV